MLCAQGVEWDKDRSGPIARLNTDRTAICKVSDPHLEGDLLYGWLAGVFGFEAEGQVILLHHVTQLLRQTARVLHTNSFTRVIVDKQLCHSFTGFG